jgi:hypothetical protein
MGNARRRSTGIAVWRGRDGEITIERGDCRAVEANHCWGTRRPCHSSLELPGSALFPKIEYKNPTK